MNIIKEVLKDALNSLDRNGMGTVPASKFICTNITLSSIGTYYDRIDTKKFFEDNRPSRELHQEFYHNKCYNENGSIWWGNTLDDVLGTNESQSERKRFLNHLINNVCP